MSKMKSMLGLYALAAINMGLEPMGVPEEVKTRGKSNLSDADRAIANGLKPFDYPQGVVYAVNQKNADKKAKKKGWI